MTIVEFLQDRISEDEALAEKASVSMHGERHDTRRSYGSYVLSSERDSTEDQDTFILDWWPARVLAECAAKRATMEQHTTHTYTDEEPGFSMELWDCLCPRVTDKPCPTIGALAAVYKDHPDFQEAWA